MSKFYSYESLVSHPPSKKAIVEAGRRVQALADERDIITVPYGSFAWGPGVYERRSDIDIAVMHEDALYDPQSSIHLDYASRCLNFARARHTLSQEAGIDIDLIFVGGSQEEFLGDPYAGESVAKKHQPSVPFVDQMRLLARRFPGRHYESFVSAAMGKRKKLDRLSDLWSYVMHSYCLYASDWSGEGLGGVNEEEILKSLGKTENLPYHIIRRCLGREKLLPHVDSKRKLRDNYFSVPYKWEIRNSLGSHFRRIFAATTRYEALVNSVVRRGMDADEYYDELREIKSVMKKAWRDITAIFSLHTGDPPNYDALDLERLKKFIEIQK